MCVYACLYVCIYGKCEELVQHCGTNNNLVATVSPAIIILPLSFLFVNSLSGVTIKIVLLTLKSWKQT